MDGGIEGCEDEKGAHEIVKWVQIVNPVSVREIVSVVILPGKLRKNDLLPERLDLSIRHQNTTEGN